MIRSRESCGERCAETSVTMFRLFSTLIPVAHGSVRFLFDESDRVWKNLADTLRLSDGENRSMRIDTCAFKVLFFLFLHKRVYTREFSTFNRFRFSVQLSLHDRLRSLCSLFIAKSNLVFSISCSAVVKLNPDLARFPFGKFPSRYIIHSETVKPILRKNSIPLTRIPYLDERAKLEVCFAKALC